MSREELVVDVSNLRMDYGTNKVLQGVELQVAPGQILGLLGPNGAGKTTTLEILEGFRRRTSGSVTVLGQDPEQADDSWRARIGIVLQNWRDHGRWRVRELLFHFGRYYRAYSAPSRPRPLNVDVLLEQLGLTEQAGIRVARLSGGQRRRLDVAIGLVGNPELLFLDEPTVGFDPEARHQFHLLVKHIAATSDTAIILTTHDLAEAENLATRIAILSEGSIIAHGSPEDLKAELARHVMISYHLNGNERRINVLLGEAEDSVRDLLNTHPNLKRLEVRRPSLEHAYLSLIHGGKTEHAAGSSDTAGSRR